MNSGYKLVNPKASLFNLIEKGLSKSNTKRFHEVMIKHGVKNITNPFPLESLWFVIEKELRLVEFLIKIKFIEKDQDLIPYGSIIKLTDRDNLFIIIKCWGPASGIKRHIGVHAVMITKIIGDNWSNSGFTYGSPIKVNASLPGAPKDLVKQTLGSFGKYDFEIIGNIGDYEF